LGRRARDGPRYVAVASRNDDATRLHPLRTGRSGSRLLDLDAQATAAAGRRRAAQRLLRHGQLRVGPRSCGLHAAV
jgi:hypothetical protein